MPYFRDEHGSQECAVFFTEFSDSKIGDEYFFTIHQIVKRKAGLGLADDIPDHGVGDKLADLVDDRDDRFAGELVIPRGELGGPEFFDQRIGDIADDFLSEDIVGKHPGNAEDACVGIFKKSQCGIPQNMFETLIPVHPEQFFEDGDESGNDILLEFELSHTFHGIESDRIFKV